MVTYGFQLAHKNSQNIFNPEIDSLLLYNGEKPVQILTAAARSLMEENYEFIKMKSQLISTNPDIPGTSFQMLQQFSRTKNRKRN